MFRFAAKTIVVAALLSAGPALAQSATDRLTVQWDYTQPHNPNSQYNLTSTYPASCPGGTVSARGVSGTYCNGQPIQWQTGARSSYGNVWIVGEHGGYQSLGW